MACRSTCLCRSPSISTFGDGCRDASCCAASRRTTINAESAEHAETNLVCEFAISAFNVVAFNRKQDLLCLRVLVLHQLEHDAFGFVCAEAGEVGFNRYAAEHLSQAGGRLPQVSDLTLAEVQCKRADFAALV